MRGGFGCASAVEGRAITGKPDGLAWCDKTLVNLGRVVARGALA